MTRSIRLDWFGYLYSWSVE